jgi:Bacterial Ig domain
MFLEPAFAIRQEIRQGCPMAVAATSRLRIGERKPETERWKRLTFWVLVLFPLLYAGVGQILGQDVDWDLQNYHFFDSYWLLTNHMRDATPAQLETYLSPILDIPFFFAAEHLPARLTGASLAVIQGLSFPLLYLINRHFTARRLVALVLAGLGMFTAGTISELGTIFGDTLLAPAFFAAILLGLHSYDRSRSNAQPAAGEHGTNNRLVLWLIVGAGLLAGFAAGLKLAELPIAVGIAIAFPLVSGSMMQRLRKAACAGIAVLVGCLVSYGWWGYELAARYGNPIMPFMNQVFHSSYAPAVSNTRHFSSVDVLFDPFIWTLHPKQLVDENSFLELSLPILEVLLVALLLLAIVRTLLFHKPFRMFAGEKERYLVVMTVISYFFWYFQFDTYRYLVPIEMLSFTLIFLTLRAIGHQIEEVLPERNHFVALGTVVIVLVCIVSEQPMNWGRSAWSSTYFSVAVPKPLTSQRAAFLMQGGNPDSFVVPYFPSNDYFAQIAGNLPPTPRGQRVIERNVAQYRNAYTIWEDPVSLSRAGFADYSLANVQGYGFDISWSTCSGFTAKVGRIPKELHICKLRPVSKATLSPLTTILSPRNGTRVTGRVALAALASSPVGVRKVEFAIAGQGREVYGTARFTLFGWIALWDSRSTPNGTYTVRSVAYGKNGRVTTSKEVTLSVEN